MIHPTQSAVILDRDGTIIHDKHYLSCPNGVELLPFAPEGLRLLQDHGLRLFVTTNQSGIGRGYFTTEQMHAVNARLEELLAQYDVRLHGIFYCPHAPDTPCSCRKPHTGMIEQLRTLHSLSPEHCFVIGDKHCDVALGHNAHMRSILVRTGYGARTEQAYTEQAHTDEAYTGEAHRKTPEASPQTPPHHIADNLLDAAQWITSSCHSSYTA